MVDEPLTSQSLFDFVVVGLGAQGGPAISAGGTCMYRAPSGLKCAAGLAIRDDEYISDMECNPVSALITTHLLPKRLIPFGDLLTALQTAHDIGSWRDLWEPGGIAFRLVRVAWMFNLHMKAVVSAFPLSK